MYTPFTGKNLYPQFDDVDILARTAYGENRGGGAIGMQSVINVIMNRAAQTTVEWWGTGVRGVCLKYLQFDCWLPTDPNFDIIMHVGMDDTLFVAAIGLAQEALNGTLTDITSGSTYYVACNDPNKPNWAIQNTPVCIIAGQQFYNNV